MKSKYVFRTLLVAVLAMGISCSHEAMAKDTMLAETKVLYKSENIKAQLWGTKVNNSYANNLSLVLKRDDGSVVTGYMPDIKGGYGATLKAVQVKQKDNKTQQLFLAVHQGDWRSYSEYRVLDISNPKAFKELLSGSDSFGIVVSARLEENNLYVRTIRDKEPLKIELNPKMVTDISNNRRKVSFGKLSSLTALDINRDGLTEFISNQQITVDNRVLADVGAVWRYSGPEEKAEKELEVKENNQKEAKPAKAKEDLLQAVEKELEKITSVLESEPEEKKDSEEAKKEKTTERLWKQEGLTIMKADLPNRKNSINNGAFFNGGMAYPVKMVAPNGEATYPQFMLNENVELENAWNKVLMEEADEYIKAFFKGQADLAFNVIRADKSLVTIQLISGKTKFVHHNISFIPGQKEKYELSSLLNVKSKNLVELLNVLNKNEKIQWDTSLTDEWYLRDKNLFLMKNVNGTDEVSAFDINNLRKYVLDKRFLPKENKENSKNTSEKTEAKGQK